MNKKLNLWENEEVKTLFKFVEVKKSEGLPLIKIFDQYGECVGRCQKSVRNYYYYEIKNLNCDKDRCVKLGINIKNHIAKKASHFSEDETNKIIDKIKSMISNGYSVRKACLVLANGDAVKMIRFQNKYRAYLKEKQIQNNNFEVSEIKECLNKSNVIKMPLKRNAMTDEDINALFMGILKLVRKQALEIAKSEVQSQISLANEKLKNMLAEIVVKTAQIDKLQGQIKVLESKTKEAQEKQIKSTIDLISNSRAKKLISEFVQKKQSKNLLNSYSKL